MRGDPCSGSSREPETLHQGTLPLESLFLEHHLWLHFTRSYQIRSRAMKRNSNGEPGKHNSLAQLEDSNHHSASL